MNLDCNLQTVETKPGPEVINRTHLAACAFEKPASFRTQLSTYSRRFITSVEHEYSGEHEISDLSTDLSLSLSTVYNLGPRAQARDSGLSRPIWHFPLAAENRGPRPTSLYPNPRRVMTRRDCIRSATWKKCR